MAPAGWAESDSWRDTPPMRIGRRMRSLSLLIAAASSCLTCRATVDSQVRRRAQRDPEVVYSVPTSAKLVALTIDDGPDPVTTPRILDLLKRHGAHATFFIITSRIAGGEDVMRRIVAEDHEIGNHMPRDEPSLKLPPDEFERQLVESDAALRPFAPVRWLRPGSGNFDARMLATIERHGYRYALGSVYPYDPQIRWSWFSRRFILSNAQPGSVVVLHDWTSKGERTIKTLSKVLPTLVERGYRIVTLSELDAFRLRSEGVPSTTVLDQYF